MPRFFFDLTNGDGFLQDDSGRELADQTAAHKEVAAIVLDLAGDELTGLSEFQARVTVRNEADEVLFTSVLSFRTDQAPGS